MDVSGNSRANNLLPDPAVAPLCGREETRESEAGGPVGERAPVLPPVHTPTGKSEKKSETPVVELPGGPGAPKGRPKPAGSGRKKGVPNKVTREAKALFHPVAKKMTRKMAKRVEEELDKGDKANLDFVTKIYTLACNYAWGRPTERKLVGGVEDGEPIRHADMTAPRDPVDLGRRLAFLLKDGAVEDPGSSSETPAEPEPAEPEVAEGFSFDLEDDGSLRGLLTERDAEGSEFWVVQLRNRQGVYETAQRLPGHDREGVEAWYSLARRDGRFFR